jgi:benzoyl-CoA reductase/2-hydroxyglutaryl-CoA dehydratase subunit BcrC/BadD/HgdB
MPLKERLRPRLSSGFLRRPVTYRLLGELAKLAYIRQGKRAQGLWLDFTGRQMQAGLRREGLVVWGNAFFPFELLYGLGVAPCHPETLAALAARLGLEQEAIAGAEAGGYSPDTCSFYRCAAGLTREDLLPRPDIVVSTTYLCDGAVKFFHNVSQHYGCDYYLLDVPYHDTAGARQYLAGQLRELALKIAARQGRPLDTERLARAIEYANEAREYQIKINYLRHAVPCPLPGGDAIGYMLDMQFFSPGSAAGAAFFKTLYEETRARVEKGWPAAAGERFRLLWFHHIRPYYPNEIMDSLEAMGASVCFGEANHVYWEPLDPERPFESLAAKMLANPSGGEIARRAALAEELTAEYSADGVIHFSHWGCRQSCGGEYVIRDVMKKRDVPVLILDGDGVDSRNYSREQTRLRLEAFIEMLEARR